MAGCGSCLLCRDSPHLDGLELKIRVEVGLLDQKLNCVIHSMCCDHMEKWHILAVSGSVRVCPALQQQLGNLELTVRHCHMERRRAPVCHVGQQTYAVHRHTAAEHFQDPFDAAIRCQQMDGRRPCRLSWCRFCRLHDAHCAIWFRKL